MGVFLDYVGQGSTPPGGHYRLGCRTTNMGATLGANGCLFSLRWTDPVHFFVLLDFKIGFGNTAFSAAQILDAYLYVARGFTAVDSGQTQITSPVQNMAKMRDSGGAQMGTSLVNQIWVANTAAITAGTRTLDTQPIGSAVFGNANTLGNAYESQLYSCNFGNDHPLILGVNEGLVINALTAYAGTGTVQYYFNLRWAEVTQF